MEDTTGIQRVCFLLHLKADRVEDYLNAHAVVWPDMLRRPDGAPAGATTRCSCGPTTA